ncbi:MAG: hypothetical protein LM522_08470, partial [Candidatus Contendobacter sp.]|nr:hypothetical protein [Candidatus Contendobacter sp.]
MKAKVLLTLVTAALLMNVGLNLVPSPRLTLLGGVTAHAGVRVDFGFFYSELAPYGDWRRLEPYGWVWHPDVAEDWRPYTSGYWVFTDDFGWTWISTEPWGSIPFHYGRWFYDEDYGGWGWVPGTEWGPAWVSWRSGGGFIGWAPLPPTAEFEPGVGFSSPRQNFSTSWNSWCFVPTAQFLNPRLERVIVPPPRNVTLINNTVNVTHYVVNDERVINRSIDPDRFEEETRTRVVRYRSAEAERPVVGEKQVRERERQVILFRPQIDRTAATPPLPPAVRTPRPDTSPGHRSERPMPGRDPWESRTDDRNPDPSPGYRTENPRYRTVPSWELRTGNQNPDYRDSIDGERNRRRPPTEQERLKPRQSAEREAVEDQQRWRAEQEQAQRQAEQQARQQAIQRYQQQQTEQEQAQQRSEREQAQRQAE